MDTYGKKKVSILVLVDLAREFYPVYALTCIHSRFNPCFSGSCSRIIFASNIFNLFSMFQSLF